MEEGACETVVQGERNFKKRRFFLLGGVIM